MKWGNFGVAILGAITWPLITLQCIFLVAFDRPFSLEKEGRNLSGKWALLYSALAVLGIVALKMTGHGIVVTNLLMRDSNLAWTAASILFISAALWGIFRCIPRFRLNCGDFVKKCDWKFLTLSVFIWVAVKIFLKIHTNEEFFSSSSIFALQILLRPLKYPLISFVGHVAFYGILPILVAFTFRNFVKAFVNRSVGFALIFALLMVFALDSESRHLATLIQLLLSHFYLPINSENILSEMEAANWTGEAAQRYFMNFGAYMSLESYLLWLGISVLAILACYGILKIQSKRKMRFPDGGEQF